MEESEHAEFIRWLHNLEQSQLLHAMEFSFQKDAQSSNSSHEFDLLVEMLQMQSPSPTPVHPRAVFYKPASGKGNTDGRNEAARVFRNRSKRPRFFRFFECKSISLAGGPFGNLPPIVAAAVASTGGRRRAGAGSRQRAAATATSRQNPRFEITARKFVTAWGDALSVGHSKETRAADETLLFYSVLDKGDATDQSSSTFMSFCGGSTSFTSSGADILRLLKVASRGNFLSTPHRQSPSNSSYDNSPAFCAPWLDPTTRWFSLPMYLSSRFEIALWESFQDNKRIVAQFRNRPWDNLEEKLSRAVIERTINKALLDTLRKDVIIRHGNGAPVSNLRDGMLFDLLDALEFRRVKEIFFASQVSPTFSSAKRFLRSISSSPLVEIGTTTDHLRGCMRQHLKAELSEQIGKDLLLAFAKDPALNNPSAQSRAATSRRNRKKKQKKKNGRKKQIPKDHSEKAEASFDDKQGDSSGDESDSNSIQFLHADGNRRLSYPNNGTPFVERNKNVVMCLSVLNDVVNEVFRRAGLEVSSDESDTPVARSTQPKIATPRAKKQPKPMQKQLQVPGTRQLHTQIDFRQQESSSEEKKSNLTQEAFAPFPPQGSEGDVSSLNAPLTNVDTFPSQYSFPESYFGRSAPFPSNPWHVYHTDNSEDGDGWGGSSTGYSTREARESSILTDFFLEQELADAYRLERITASSTAASLASSTDKNNEDTLSISDKFFISLDDGGDAPASDIGSVGIESNVISAEEFPALGIYPEEHSDSHELLEDASVPQLDVGAGDYVQDATDPSNINDTAIKDSSNVEGHSATPAHSVTPEAPATPSPRLSPILLSLDDLRDIRTGAGAGGNGVSASVPSSLPSSPVDQSKRRLLSTLSRENLRVKSFRDDHEFIRSYRRNQTVEGNLTYRNVAAGSAKIKVRTTRSVSGDSHGKVSQEELRSAFTPLKKEQNAEICARSENQMGFRDNSLNSGELPSYRNVAAKSVTTRSWNPLRSGTDRKFKPQLHRDLCAKSETAIDAHEDYPMLHRHNSRRSLPDNPDNIVTVEGKDGSTTITSASAISHRDSEEAGALREERNTFRDMCLTLGAEVSKLKNQLAAQQGAAVYPAFGYTQDYVQPPVFGAASFDPECMPPFFQKGQALGAMSDAGVHRGEYALSEDGEHLGMVTYTENGRRLSSGHTLAGSDISVEPTSISRAHQSLVGLPPPISKEPCGGAGNALQTRLTHDIFRFVASADIQHKKLGKIRNAAVERMTRFVNTLWPRAQVKVYGSHVTGLCLPSSDMDFVVCLPAVHKNAPAVAPGALEGRNAINESSQRLLARKLKGESWIDPRSMKLIERTMVPVIKVATKDTRARTVQLDISFDSADHHGLEAVVMVTQIMDELPMVRPLVLVLKQFLFDRALLTAYTGGLSSYCLFLMVARYLQEQPSSWADPGSLLMGFLDFYGNCFDPRCTGISVGQRQYFTRPNYTYAAAQGQPPVSQHMWAGVSPNPAAIPSPASNRSNTDFYRRNSFGGNRSVDGLQGSTGSPHVQSPPFQSHRGARYDVRMSHSAVHGSQEAPDHSMPFTFDPLFVDDPLSYGNNVGRNAFRIFQVQRAFSDAHRALVASLEWDIQSTGDLHENNDYPLLKCLLQSEDMFYEV